ncbi:hypothetical protein JCM10049v2_006640 [Rhodotorula toruloides]
MSSTRLAAPATRSKTVATPTMGTLPLSKAYPSELVPTDTSPTSPFTLPPPNALVFKQHVHRYPEPVGLVERTRIWYMGVFWEVLEPWERVWIHSLLFALLFLLYIAFSRLFAPTHVAHIADRLRWYIFGLGSAVEAFGGAGGMRAHVGAGKA